VNVDFKVHTFGCKVNTYDTGLIERRLVADGFAIASEPRIHVLNTCAVTREATLEAGRLARRLKSRDPFCLVVATGCAAQVDTEELERQAAIDLIVANSHKTELTSILKRYYQGALDQKVFKSNIFKKEDVEPGGGIESKHTRSFLKIQDGCNSFCTFCVIPFARGKSRSIEIASLVRRVQELEESGVGEVVLTGVHIGDYEDHGLRLEDLLEALIAKTSMPRFRLSSMEPPEISERLLDLYASEKICPHFHMSIQSPQSEVLKNMKRQYDADGVTSVLHNIKHSVPEAFVGMDIIAGFPTETDAQFEETMQRLRDLPWSRIHVFPYSRRPGTFAARWDTLTTEKMKFRTTCMRQLSEQRLKGHALNQIGKTKKVLPLRSRVGAVQGLARDYWTVELDREPNSSAEVTVVITGLSAFDSQNSERLVGEIQ
jgi:threonylcarbamoyladenosine tRNA methylthiotransferase MtaB